MIVVLFIIFRQVERLKINEKLKIRRKNRLKFLCRSMFRNKMKSSQVFFLTVKIIIKRKLQRKRSSTGKKFGSIYYRIFRKI